MNHRLVVFGLGSNERYTFDLEDNDYFTTMVRNGQFESIQREVWEQHSMQVKARPMFAVLTNTPELKLKN